MSNQLKSAAAACCVIAMMGAGQAADVSNGRDIAKRWCASCHLIESGQTNATDQAPPFAYLAKTPDFDRSKLAFLLLMPHPNMPNLSLNRSEVADLAEYIRSLK